MTCVALTVLGAGYAILLTDIARLRKAAVDD